MYSPIETTFALRDTVGDSPNWDIIEEEKLDTGMGEGFGKTEVLEEIKEVLLK